MPTLETKDEDHLVAGMETIGYINTPYDEKFAVPRQPGLAPHAVSTIFFYPPYDDPLAFEGLEGFSHIHVIFLFDRIKKTEFSARVRPPRLGGNRRIGVFASRSPFRPSRIGLSVMKLEKIGKNSHGGVFLVVSGADLTNRTPIVDIKPYVPFVDAVPDAKGGFADQAPKLHEVCFSKKALDDLNDLNFGEIAAIKETLAQDPRPAYKNRGEDDKIYGFGMYRHEIRFKVSAGTILVESGERVTDL